MMKWSGFVAEGPSFEMNTLRDFTLARSNYRSLHVALAEACHPEAVLPFFEADHYGPSSSIPFFFLKGFYMALLCLDPICFDWDAGVVFYNVWT